jgi:ABC-2 type transport system ATP-binding protein
VISAGRLLTEGTVAEIRGASSTLLRAEPLAAAETAAAGVLGAAAVSIVDGSLRLAGVGDRIAEVVRALVLADIAVHEVRPVERSLEDAFFEMTTTPTTPGDRAEVPA